MSAETGRGDAYVDLEDPIIDIEACIKLLDHVIEDEEFPGGAIYLSARLKEHVAELRQRFNDGFAKR